MAINKRKDEFAKHITRICDDRGNKALEELKQQIKDKEKAKKKIETIRRSTVEVEFDQSILLWHVATNVCDNSV